MTGGQPLLNLTLSPCLHYRGFLGRCLPVKFFFFIYMSTMMRYIFFQSISGNLFYARMTRISDTVNYRHLRSMYISARHVFVVTPLHSLPLTISEYGNLLYPVDFGYQYWLSTVFLLPAPVFSGIVVPIYPYFFITFCRSTFKQLTAVEYHHKTGL